MYRQTIEHPEWIPIETQRKLDLRAGSDMGRVYRVFPIGSKPRKIPRLDKLSTAELVKAMDSPNGWQRDMVQQMLVWRGLADAEAVEPLGQLAANSTRPLARVQALWTLELLGALKPEAILHALSDAHPGVRRHAIQLAESHLAETPKLGEGILRLDGDDDSHVQVQRAYTLGEWKDSRAGRALGDLAIRFADNRFITAAVLSSITADNLHDVTTTILAVEGREPPGDLVEQLVGLASTLGDDRTLASALTRIASSSAGQYADWQLTALAGLLDALDRRETSWEKYDLDGKLSTLFEFARSTAENAQAPDETRFRAVRLLGRGKRDRTTDVRALAALLVPQSSGSTQSAAVAALTRIDDDEAPRAMLSGWKGHSPALRSEILDALLSRGSWTKALLDAVERKDVPAADIDATRRQRLARSSDAEIKDRAAKLLAGAIESNRAQVLADHAKVLEMTGDAQAGATIFAKRCSVCHRLRGAGHDVGPNLASLTDYSPQALLTALLDPNRAVEAKFLDYIAVTTSGLTHTGLLADETGNSVTLLGQEGKQQTILRTDLETLQATGKSMMPEGLEKDLGPQDLANVIAYLRGSGAPRKTFFANSPQLVKPIVDGTLQLYPTTCEIYGPSVVMERLYKNLAKWQSENDRVVWNIELSKAGRYQVLINYACLDRDAGNSWLLEAGDKTLTGKVAATGSIDRYQEVPGGVIELAAGPGQITFRSAGPVKGNLLQLGGILLKPVK
jgi:putative heme-binding domain-containing protein